MSDKLFDLVQQEIQKTVDQQTGITRPFVVLAVGGRRYQEMKRSVAQHVVERMPETAYQAEAYAEERLDLRRTIVERMKMLDTDHTRRCCGRRSRTTRRSSSSSARCSASLSASFRQS